MVNQEEQGFWALFSPETPTELWTMMTGMGVLATAVFTLVLAVTAARGLKSLKLAQGDMLNRATREALQCAIDRCREMADTMIPLHSAILQEFRDGAVPMFVTDPSAVTFGDHNEEASRGPAAKWVEPLDPELYAKCIELLNTCETWAIYFTNGLASGDVAHKPCAPVFISIVIQLYPLLVHLRGRDESGDFPNVVELFQAWYGQTAEERDAELAERLLTQARNLQMKGGAYKRLPDPMGTEPLI